MATLICPSCNARYAVHETQIEAVKKFRCKQCRSVAPVQGNVLLQASGPDPTEARADFPTYYGLKALFDKEGMFFFMSGNTPVTLDTNRFVWRVNSGKIDLFGVPTEDGQPSGSRTHLLRLEQGALLWGTNSRQRGQRQALMAVGDPETSLLRLDARRFQEIMLRSDDLRKEVRPVIDAWVTALLARLRSAPRPEQCLELTSSAEEQIAPQTNYTAAGELLWVSHLEGASLFGGDDRLSLIQGGSDKNRVFVRTNFFPLSKQIWLQAQQQLRLETRSTATLLQENTLWDGLEQFQAFMLESLEQKIQSQKIAERERFRRQAQAERRSFSQALADMAEVAASQKFDLGAAADDPLLAACRAIGERLQIDIVPHPEAANGRNTLEDIALASNFRMRKVLLRDQWQRGDHGPLLGFIKETRQPVALLPDSPGRYTLWNPSTGERKHLNAKVAETLDDFAYMFYRAFPDRVLSLSDMLKAGAQGIGGDVRRMMLTGVLGMLLGLLLPYLTGVIFDTVIPATDMHALAQIGVILLVCTLATALFDVTKVLALLRIQGQTEYTLQAALIDRILWLPAAFFRRYSAGDVANRGLGINAIRQIVSATTMQVMLSGLFSLGYWGLLFYYDVSLALAATAIALAATLFTLILGYFKLRAEAPVYNLEGKIAGMMLQFITGVSKLRITGAEDRAFAVWAKSFSAQRRHAFQAGQIQNYLETGNAVIPVFSAMLLFSLLLSGMRENPEEALSAGKFIAFLAAYGIFQTTLLQMGLTLLDALRVVPLYERLKPIMQTRPEKDALKTHPGRVSGDIEVSQVAFRYLPNRPLVLQNISLHIRSGEFVAIAGSSGSGKSTLMRMLLGFETPESGTIYYDGQDISKVDILELRRQIGVVLQESQILAGSIFHNIVGAGASHLTLDDAWEAARMAGCEEDIRALPMQMHTILPPGGGTLSGGQRQRILIARALVKKPKILFFDEATSALDNRTQRMVSEQIERLRTTRVVIAHRLSTIINADRIYVMDQGRVAQVGTYHDLIEQEGLFADLARRQLL